LDGLTGLVKTARPATVRTLAAAVRVAGCAGFTFLQGEPAGSVAGMTSP